MIWFFFTRERGGRGFKKRESEPKGQITRSLRKTWKWERQVTVFGDIH